jgi:sulfur carrier protein ThiS
MAGGMVEEERMNVDVALFASLSAFQPDGQGGRSARSFDVPDGTTVTDFISRLGLPDQPRIVFVNGRHAPESAALADGDRLAIFPPVAGG